MPGRMPLSFFTLFIKQLFGSTDYEAPERRTMDLMKYIEKMREFREREGYYPRFGKSDQPDQENPEPGQPTRPRFIFHIPEEAATTVELSTMQAGLSQARGGGGLT